MLGPNCVQPKRDVVGERVGKQKGLLRHETDRTAQHRQRHVPHVDAVDEHGAGGRIVQTCKQADERGLAGSGDADEGDGLAGFDPRGDMIEHRRRAVAEYQVAKFDLAANLTTIQRRARGARRENLVAVCDCRLGVEHFEHPLPRRHAALQHVGHPPERDHRPTQHRQIRVERDELSERDSSANHLTAADPQDDERAEPEQE